MSSALTLTGELEKNSNHSLQLLTPSPLMALSPPPTQDPISLLLLKPPDPPDITTSPMEVETTLRKYLQGDPIEKTLDKVKRVSPQYHQVETELEASLIKGNTEPIEQKLRIYHPRRFSVTIKVFGRNIAHHVLKTKLQQLWTPIEQLILIDPSWDFLIVKFAKEENMTNALHGGPWFIMGHFLSIRNWEPNFIANSPIQATTIWIWLPQLLTEFYDKEILEKSGEKDR